MLLQLLLVTALWIHGGQYQPPPDITLPELPEGVLAQPGFGPLQRFDPQAWEWWFEFNQEAVLDLRARLPARAARRGAAWQPVTDDDRLRLVMPRLVEALRDRNRDVRSAATMALARLRIPDALGPVAIVAESDRDLFVRTLAVLALGFSGRAEAVETLSRLYADTDLSEEVRSHAIVGLGLIGDAAALGVISGALDEKALAKQGNVLQASVVYAAGLPRDGPLTTELLQLIGSHLLRREAQLRALAAVALGQGGRPEAVPAVQALLSDDDSQVRRSAAMALEALAPVLGEDVAAALVERADDDNDLAVRLALLRALGRSRTTAAREYLRPSLVDARYLHQAHQALALGFDGEAADVAPLLELLESTREPSLRSAIAIALGLLEADDAVEPIVALWEREQAPLPRGYLSLAVGLLDPRQGDAAVRLDEILRDTHDIEVIRLGTLGLGLLGARDRLDALAAELPAVPGVIERAARAFALGQVGDRRMLGPLLDLAGDPEEQPYVRAYALQALADLCDPRPLPPHGRLSRHVALDHDVGFLFEFYRTL